MNATASTDLPPSPIADVRKIPFARLAATTDGSSTLRIVGAVETQVRDSFQSTI